MSDEPSDGGVSGRRARKSLVTLGAAAVLAVWGAGYLRTQEAARLLEGDDDERSRVSPGSALAPVTGSVSVAPSAGAASLGAASADVDTAGAADPAAVGFRDGRYTGLGRSRHGNIEATLEIEDGRIVSAAITTCKTLYPCSRIDEVVPQVVERQDSWIDNVSGATVSVTAFYRAVVQALKQAQ